MRGRNTDWATALMGVIAVLAFFAVVAMSSVN